MGLFGIGTPVQSGTVIGYTMNSGIAQPRGMTFTPAGYVGVDAWGQPQVRGYGHMQWVYPTLPVGDWYTLENLWRSSRNMTNPWGLVQLQWPDPQSGGLVTATARFDTPIYKRDWAVFRDVTLTFTHMGIDDTSAIGFWLPPPDVGAPGP